MENYFQIDGRAPIGEVSIFYNILQAIGGVRILNKDRIIWKFTGPFVTIQMLDELLRIFDVDEPKITQFNFFKGKAIEEGMTEDFIIFEPTAYAEENNYKRLFYSIAEGREKWEEYKKEGLDSLFYAHIYQEDEFQSL